MERLSILEKSTETYGETLMNMMEKIEERKEVLHMVKVEIIQRLHIQKEESQIDDDTPLFEYAVFE